MAIVTRFEKDDQKRPKLQPTTVTCYWSVSIDDGHGSGPLLQLETRGSAERKTREKPSQTLQFTIERARQLCEILQEHLRTHPPVNRM